MIRAYTMFKIKFLRNILLTSFAVVVMFPLYNIFIAYPSFIRALTEEAKDQAVRTSTHLSSALKLQERELGSEYLAIDSVEIETVKKDLNIVKIKIFSASGDAVYSTDRNDVRGITDKKQFNEIIARGNVYTKVKNKGSRSLEGKSIRSVQFVETYVPVIKEGKFLGAIEIYYDISTAKERFDTLRSQAVLFVVILASGLLFLVLMTSYKASKIIAERNHIAEEREKLIVELREALTKVKTLSGLLPICSSCNKIRDEKNQWTNVDVYVSRHSEAEFTHGYCPECERIQFPSNFEKV
jgi:hypothetical protein